MDKKEENYKHVISDEVPQAVGENIPQEHKRFTEDAIPPDVIRLQIAAKVFLEFLDNLPEEKTLPLKKKEK